MHDDKKAKALNFIEFFISRSIVYMQGGSLLSLRKRGSSELQTG